MAEAAFPPDVFRGVRVVELAQWLFVPTTGVLLADWGADVIKIEHPVTGDSYRGLASQGIHPVSNGINPALESANRGKRSLGLDVSRPGGRDLFLRLVARADVFLTNFLPGSLDRLGFTLEALRAVNPGLIVARGHGFGARGPDRDMPGYDATAYWARGGLGETLTPAGLAQPIAQRGGMGDRSAAAQLAFGIAGALFRRERTGEPSVVDVSLLATAMWTLGSDVLSALQGHFRPAPPIEERSPTANPLVNTYRTRDGRFLSLIFLQPDRYWPELCRALGRPELAADPRFADIAARERNRAECVALLDAVFAARTYTEWCEQLAGERFPWAPFQRVTELIEDRQVLANDYIAPVEVEGGQPFAMPTGAVQFDAVPPRLRRAPEHGQHTEEVLLELGCGWEEIQAFRRDGVL
jgi:crotonobetainyl-CoA:carnitine CoA-transferase CaiB-like acyl-CoA transferase